MRSVPTVLKKTKPAFLAGFVVCISIFSAASSEAGGGRSAAAGIRAFLKKPATAYHIHVEDMLGEGAGRFDDQPRYLPSEMNCTTWLQTALAHGYATSEAHIPETLDKIRYYKGIIGYGTRLHFTDNWVALSPGPLQPVSFEGCTAMREKTVEPDYARFKDFREYRCPLYEESRAKVSVRYHEPDGFLSCSKSLEPGVYVVFPVASDRYIEIFGKNSGPMGMVHGIILDVTETPTGRQRLIHHASITKGAVVSKPLEDYVKSPAAQNFLGYTLWKLDPDWNSDADLKLTAEEAERVEKVLSCEQGLTTKSLIR